MSVNNPDDTVILEISATDPNPAVAQSIANSAAEQLGREVVMPSAPRTPLYFAVGVLVGLAIGVGLVVAGGRRKVDEEPVAVLER